MKEIYNEGRVTGYSVYEIYLRQLMSSNPDATPMTEREWLTCTLANNSSMILKIPSGTPEGIHDYVLPEGSNLAACTAIFGSMFDGEVTLDDSGYWAIRVDQFGDPISNTHELYPETPGTPEFVPFKPDPTQENTVLIERATEFIKIRQAVVIQPGEWKDIVYPPAPEPEPEPPAHENARRYLEPNLHERGFVRILLTERTEADTYILLHGFVDKLILEGDISFLFQGSSNRPMDGDFLGPAMFPWACPVTLIISTEIEEALLKYQEDINKKLFEIVTKLCCRTRALGTLPVVTWGTPLFTESGERLLTEDGDPLLADKVGTVTEMWQEEGEITC